MALRNCISLMVSVIFICGLKATAWAQEPGKPAETPTPTQSETLAETKEEPKTTEIQSWPSFEKAFQAGVANYQSQKYEEARNAFNQALEMEPESAQTLTNLALVQYQMGQKAWAVALLRKAHNLEPSFSTPKAALEFILPQLDVKEIPHEIQLWESVRSAAIVPYSLNSFLFLTALTLFSAGWLWLKYLGQRRQALREEKLLPSFPVTAALFAITFFAFLSLTGLKVWDLETPRGTVVAEKVPVYSAPSKDSVALFDLFGGLEIILRTTDSDWVQVTYPGALTGWIPKSSVFQTSGRSKW